MNPKKLKAFFNNCLHALAGTGFIVFIISIIVLSILCFIKYLWPYLAEFFATKSGNTVTLIFKIIFILGVGIFSCVMYRISYMFSMTFIENDLAIKPTIFIKTIISLVAVPLFLFLAIMTPVVSLGRFLSKRRILWIIGVIIGFAITIASVVVIFLIPK